VTEGRPEAAAEAPEADGEHHLDDGSAGRKVIRGGAMRTASYVAGILTGIVSTPLMFRHLGADRFGQYATVNSLIFVVTGLTEGGLAAIALREYSAYPDRRERLMRNLLGLRGVLFVVGVIGALGFAVAAGYPEVMVWGTAISCGGLLLNTLFGICSVPLMATLRQGVLATFDFVRQLIVAALVVALVIVGAGLLPFFVPLVVASAVAAVGAWWATRREVPRRPSVDLAEWKRLLWQSVPYGLATAFATLYFRVGIIIMSLVSSAYETGLYALAFRVVELVSGVPYLLVFVAFPVLARAAGTNDAERLRNALQRMFEVSVILGVGAAIGIGLGAPFAVHLIGGKVDDAAITPLVVLGTAMIGTFLVATWSYALLSLERNRILIAANGSAVVLGIALAVALAEAHGALGAAIATSATELTLAVVYGFVITRIRPDLRPRLGILPKAAVAAAVAVAVPLLLGLPSVVSALLGLALFVGVLLPLGGVPREVLHALRLARS
jgi:O-antigen/teichoic acid export membrane protein